MFPFTLAGNKNGSDRRSPALPAVRDYDPPVSVRRFQSRVTCFLAAQFSNWPRAKRL